MLYVDRSFFLCGFASQAIVVVTDTPHSRTSCLLLLYLGCIDKKASKGDLSILALISMLVHCFFFLQIIFFGGITPEARRLVWPFLLNVYSFDSTHEERAAIREDYRKVYEALKKKR